MIHIQIYLNNTISYKCYHHFQKMYVYDFSICLILLINTILIQKINIILIIIYSMMDMEAIAV